VIQDVHLTPIPAELARPLGEGILTFRTFTMHVYLSGRRLAQIDIRRTLEMLGTNGSSHRRPPGRRVRLCLVVGAGGR
jgi:hypothetical protein